MFTIDIFEQQTRPVTVCFGRMNPPTLGHKQLLDTVASAAKGGDFYIFATKTHKLSDNPLPYDVKYKFLTEMFPEYADKIVYNPELKTIMQVAQWLYDQGYTELNFVAGSDRIPEFEKLLKTYNGKGQPGDKGYYIFTNINMISAGERDADAEGLAGISASKARAAAKAGNFEDFVEKTGAGKLAKPLYDAVREAMGVSEDIAADSQSSTSPIHGGNIEEEAAGVGVVATNKKMARDPRYSMSITKDVKPQTPKNMLRAFRLSEHNVQESLLGDMAKALGIFYGLGTSAALKQQKDREAQAKELEKRKAERQNTEADPEFDKWFDEYNKQRIKNLSIPTEPLNEKWSQKQRRGVDCNNPKGFSQRAHCAGRRARQAGKHTKSSKITESKRAELATVPMIKKFLPIVKQELNLEKLPKIKIQRHVAVHDGQATFGRFVNGEETVYVGIADRHPVDVLRTLAHELVHWRQFLDGRIEPGSGETGSPIENEAHAVAGVLMRNFNKKYPNAVKLDNIELQEDVNDYVSGNLSYSKSLNPVAWENERLKPEVRDRLLKIAGEFVKYIQVPNFKIEDVVLTGSMANYNWTKYSDFDLHVVTRYADVQCDDIVEEFYRAKKDLWNNQHDITIGGYEVEMYVEDLAKPPVSAGIYSILDNKWLKKPDYDNPEVDESAVNAKVTDLVKQIKLTIQTADSADDIQRLKDKLRKMRRAGLDTNGEFSVENLSYKIIRNLGLLDKLNQVQTDQHDEKLSLPEEEQVVEIQRKPSMGDKDEHPEFKGTVSADLIKKIKRIPGNDRYGYIFGPAVGAFLDTTHRIDLYDLNHPTKKVYPAGYLAFRKMNHFPLPNAYQVTLASLDPQYRGKGLGQTLYGIGMKVLGMTIVSDVEQTPEARRMWVNLQRIPGVEIFGYTEVSSKSWANRNNPDRIYDYDDLNIIKAVRRVGGREIGSDQIFTYLAFPVTGNVDRGELASLNKKLAIYSARHPEEGGITNGLFARWVGGK
jgi:hypothetical protein